MSRRVEREFFLLLLVLLSAAPALKSLRSDIEPDTFVHLRIGEWVLEHKRVPVADHFSAPVDGRDRPWIATSWAFDMALASFHRIGGLEGVVLFRVCLVFLGTVSLFQFVLKRTGDGLWPLALLAAAVIALMPLPGEGTGHLTLAFCVWSLDAALDIRAGASAWGHAWLPGVFAVWANVDVQFVFGLAVLVLGCVAPMLDGLVARVVTRLDARLGAAGGGMRPATVPWSLLVLTAACAVAVLANPYRQDVYAEAVAAVVSPVLRVSDDLAPPDPREAATWAGLVLWAGAWFALGRRPRIGTFEVLLLVTSAYFVLGARRDQWLAILAALAVLARPREGAADSVPLWRTALLTLAAFALLAVGLGKGGGLTAQAGRSVAERYPAGAAEFLRTRPDLRNGPLFSDPDWGGYLLAALPGSRVIVDGRAASHGADRLRDLRGLWDEPPPDWTENPDLRSARVIVADRRRGLTRWLIASPQFRVAAERGPAVVLVRAD